MPRTLYARLASVLVVLVIGMGLVYALISTYTTRQYLQELNQRFNRDLARRIVADRDLVAQGQLDRQALKETFSAYMAINPSIEIYLLDLQGGILSFSAEPGRVKRRSVDLGPIRDFLSGAEFPLLGDDPRSHDRRKAFSVTPVPDGDAPQGYLYVVLRGEEFDAMERGVLEGHALRLSAWSVAGSLGFGLLAGLLLFHWLTRRLQRLSALMQEFQDGGFTRPTPYASARPEQDEIERLGAVFDGMARRIVDQLLQLKAQDRLRRELLAQISHDLRTPLAAVHGSLQTLRMKPGLAAGERDTQLTVALRQSDRLRRMVDDLFELTGLEAKDTQPRLERFAAAELAQDVMLKFRPRAERAGIAMALSTPQGPTPVLADLALTERVLDNLIGNALEHTPRGGEIRLILRTRGRLVSVTVADTGPGIARDDLERVFEPFRRCAKPDRQSAHAGLGLAIARRIVELQGGTIGVRNGSRGGARFVFTLPYAESAVSGS